MNHLTPCNVLVTWFMVYSCIFVTQVTKSNKCKRKKPLSPNRNLEIINYWKSWSAVSRAWNRPNWIENEPMLRQLALFVLVCLCAVYYETISTLWFAFTPMTVTPFLRTFPNLRNRLFWMRLQCYQKLSFSVLIKGEQGTNTIKPMFTIKQNCVRCTPFAQWSLNLWCKNRKQRYIEHFWDISTQAAWRLSSYVRSLCHVTWGRLGVFCFGDVNEGAQNAFRMCTDVWVFWDVPLNFFSGSKPRME